MTAQHKTEKEARRDSYAAALESWKQSSTQSGIGSSTRKATIHYQNATPTAAPLVVNETQK